MSDDAPERGRLFLVTGADATGRDDLAAALAGRLDRSIVIDAGAFDRMVVSGRVSADRQETTEYVRQLLLRWSAGIAVAETYQLEGFDAVLTDEIVGDRLEDFLDLVAPETVQLVVLEPTDRSTPRWGLWLNPTAAFAEDLADAVLAHLDEATVVTAESPAASD